MKESNHTPFEWAIWGLIVVSSTIILLSAVIYFLFKYKKENKRVLTIQKIPILGIFLAIFVIQAYFTRVLPHTSEIIPFSLDDITIVAVGFLFGPIEAIFYGAIADSTRTLINGWGFQIISFFIFPLTGLIAGIYGNMYKKNKGKNKTSEELFKIESLFLLFAISGFAWLIIFVEDLRFAAAYSYLGMSLFFIFLLSIWLYLNNKNEKYNDLNLIFLISLTVILSRAYTGYIIRPFAQHFYFNYNWLAEVNLRIVTSSYLVYIRIFVYFYFVKSVFYAVDIVK